MTEEERRQQAFSVSELLVLAHVWRERSVDTSSAARLIQQDEAQARAILGSLVETGMLEGRGRKRGRTYLLSASIYRALGQPAAYVHARGFETEQIILQFVRAHGRIVRREAAELCRIGPYQATRLLKKLVEQEMLARQGERKGTYYTLRSNI